MFNIIVRIWYGSFERRFVRKRYIIAHTHTQTHTPELVN